MAERSELRCSLTALLAAWVTMIFGTSLLMAAFGPLGASQTGLWELARAALDGADEMAPAVKLLLIALFALQVLGGRRLDPQRPWQRVAVNAALGVSAMLLTLALVPESFSRGFGVGLTGARFDPVALPVYLCGGALGGVVFTLSWTRCRAARSQR
jgi:hypothetical protein